MPVNKVAENVLGTIGKCLAPQLRGNDPTPLIPQVWKSWREKSTEGLASGLMLMWAFGAWFQAVYVVVQNINVPLIIQPQLFGFLATLSFVQCLYYGYKRPLRHCVLFLLTAMALFGGLEAGVTIAMKGHRGPGLRFFGVFSAVMIALGLVPQYIEIWRRKEVVGVSMLFLAIDISGGVFSLLSLIFKPTFDVVAALTYIAVIVLDGVVVVMALVLNPLARKRREKDDAEMQVSPTEVTQDEGNLEKASAQKEIPSHPSDVAEREST